MAEEFSENVIHEESSIQHDKIQTKLKKQRGRRYSVTYELIVKFL